jgi:molecular chaperone GrpE (heat shock protein)
MAAVEAQADPNTIVAVMQKGYACMTASCGRRW